jgi:hypothetical protein
MKIPLPRVPERMTRALDAYSDWASEPTGPTLRIMRWRYQVLRRDWVSIAQVLITALAFAWWTAGGPMAFGIGVATGIFAWTWIEASYMEPRS